MELHIPKLREGSYFPSVNDGLEMSHFNGLKLNHLVFAQRFGQCA